MPSIPMCQMFVPAFVKSATVFLGMDEATVAGFLITEDVSVDEKLKSKSEELLLFCSMEFAMIWYSTPLVL